MKSDTHSMTVPLLDLKPQLAPLREEFQAAIMEVVDSGAFILGAKVESFEAAMADYLGAAHAIGVSSGTDALLLALIALEVGPGDLVITTPFSFFASAGVVDRRGARPLFADIDPVTFNLQPESLKALLEGLSAKERKRVKAIIPVHLYGQCADMGPIREIAETYGLPLVEDAAQAIGAEYPAAEGTRRAGTMGAVGCYSFFPTKNLGAMGDAGLITTQDTALAEKIRIQRVHGAHPKYFHKVVGGNFRMDALQAAVLLVKLPHLERWHQERQTNADRYLQLSEERGLRQIVAPRAVYRASGLNHAHIFNQFVIRTPERDRLRAFLGKNRIGAEIYYPLPLHLQECFAHLGYREGDFPESERAAKEVLALPIYAELTAEMQAYTVDKIKEFFDE